MDNHFAQKIAAFNDARIRLRDIKSSLISASRGELCVEYLDQLSHSVKKTGETFESKFNEAVEKEKAYCEADHARRGLSSSTVVTNAVRAIERDALKINSEMQDELDLAAALIASKKRLLDPAIAAN